MLGEVGFEVNDFAGRPFVVIHLLPQTVIERRKQGKSAREVWRIVVENWQAKPKQVELHRPPFEFVEKETLN